MAAYALHRILVLAVWATLVPLVNEIWMSVQPDCTLASHQRSVLICLDGNNHMHSHLIYLLGVGVLWHFTEQSEFLILGTTANVNRAMKRITMNVMISMNVIIAHIAAIRQHSVLITMATLNVFVQRIRLTSAELILNHADWVSEMQPSNSNP